MLSKNMKNLRKGFTLVEIMIVVLIIGILLAIAVPNFVRARESARAKSCVANLKQIQSANQQFVMDGKLAGTTVVASGDIVGPDKYIKVAPTCPSTGVVYASAAADANPVCPNATTATSVTTDPRWHGIQ